MSSVYSYKHHIIPFHEWRHRINQKATRSNKDFNKYDNVVWLTLDQHIHVHQLLYELNGNCYDKIAYLALSGQIGKEEATRLAHRAACVGSTKLKGVPKSPEHCQAIKDSWDRESRIASKETRLKMSLAHKGNNHRTGIKYTPEQRIRLSLSRMGKKRGPYKPETKPRKKYAPHSIEARQRRILSQLGKKRGHYKKASELSAK